MERTDILLSMLANHKTPLVGTTRLQKLLFLIEKEANIKITDDNFDFEADSFGPSSDKVYDDLNFLENLGYIERSGEDKIEENLNINDIEKYSADLFLTKGGMSSDELNTEAKIKEKKINNEEIEESDFQGTENDLRIYKITQKGLNYIKKKGINDTEEYKFIDKIVKRYSKRSLISLLQYVYSHYDEYTVNSIIKDRIS